ncbi:hypothetical protein BpHYR1_054137 [Brachionus plicatilis]|uniref:Uncharacterized protein n=1 Tax=Brachionus plicatilis TaxID=10195 RepID=A0A3M7S8W4_BRAPC|nr:hypothetical protein BpHYR1_054137 [Brachionus plicatilis]
MFILLKKTEQTSFIYDNNDRYYHPIISFSTDAQRKMLIIMYLAFSKKKVKVLLNLLARKVKSLSGDKCHVNLAWYNLPKTGHILYSINEATYKKKFLSKLINGKLTT